MSSDRLVPRMADILDNIERIERHVRGTGESEFLGSELLIDGVERCLERIAEAARKIGDRLDQRYADLNLHRLRQFGSVLRDDYDSIRPGLLWDFIQNELPKLLTMARTERHATNSDQHR